MTKTPAKNECTPGGRLRTFRRWLKRHPIAVALVLAALVGLALGWNWLVSSGLLLGVLAGLGCLARCGLRLFCGHKKDGGHD